MVQIGTRIMHDAIVFKRKHTATAISVPVLSPYATGGS